ncbi:MAG: hypothetical protein LBK74_01635 [Treponema sp.]|nr:hypothetical protein [Treponema sp.]
MGADKIKIDALVKFPNMPLDPFFIVWPEANLWYSQSARMDHVAYMETKFTKSFIPFMNGNYSETKPFLLDKDEGLLAFVYYRDGYGENEKKYVLYNYKKDILLDDDPEDIDVYYIGFLDADSLLALTETFENEEWVRDYFLYDWKTGKKTENNLTKKLTELAMTEIYCRAVGNVNTKNRFLIAKSEALGGHVKINWDEDFKDVTVTPINVLIPKDKYYSEFTISSGGEWAHSLVGGIRGFTKNGFISTRFIILTTGIPAG